jgi:hypothetical protein
MSFMAYSLPTVALDIGYWSGSTPLVQEKGRRALRRRPHPATAGSRGRFRCFALFIGSTGYLVDAITRGYEMTVLT